MGLTKAGANYARHMDEVFEQERRDGFDPTDRDWQEWDFLRREAEYLYLQSHKPAKGAALNSPDNVPAKNTDNGNNVR